MRRHWKRQEEQPASSLWHSAVNKRLWRLLRAGAQMQPMGGRRRAIAGTEAHERPLQTWSQRDPQHSSPSISQSLSYSRSNLDLSHSLALFPSFHFNPNRLSSLGRAAAGQRSADVGDGGRDDAAALEAPGGTTRVVLVALGSE